MLLEPGFECPQDVWFQEDAQMEAGQQVGTWNARPPTKSEDY